jgi:hypothetical protein
MEHGPEQEQRASFAEDTSDDRLSAPAILATELKIVYMT